MKFISDELAELRESGLYRELRTVDGPQGAHVRLAGREVLCFASNDYLGLANHPKVVEAARRAMDTYGWGAGASRLVCGNMRLHQELEERIARFEGTEAALVFPSGYMANVGAVTALIGVGDLVLGDKLNHASIVDGCRLSGAKFRTYGHGDVKKLHRLMARRPHYRRAMAVTDTVFSMDGDLAPLPEITALCRAHDAMLMVDEAHATGVFGETGRGLVEHFGLKEQVDVTMGTLSKAVGSVGGFIAGSQDLVDYLRNKARTFMFTTALPPAACAAAIVGLDLIEQQPELRAALWRNVQRLTEGLNALGLVRGEGRSPIIPVVLGEPKTATAFSTFLLNDGVLAPAIRPPAVPPGTSRLRLTVSAAHSAQDIHRLLDALSRALRQLPAVNPCEGCRPSQGCAGPEDDDED
ncbi:MAG: 8-amino-7-oxononanoate synthase [Planctomycetes bacterium]|nr:8-amino-7-oxononanoate synthase [Planctomycetota bacterium]